MQQSHGTESSEDSPLLSSSVRNVSSPEIGHETGSEPLREKRSSKLIVILILLYLLLLDLGYEFIVPAQTQIFEQIYCKAYYKGHDLQWSRPGEPHGIDEKLCKIPVVQGQVARLKGWQTAFDSFGMLVFSVPWAYIADARGRKPVVLLLTSGLFIKYTFVQMICFLGGAIPLEWAWLSALHTALGGSVTVATALIYTMISDVISESKRVSVFFQVLATTITTQFIGPLISAALMVRSPWIPMLLGLAVELLSILVLFMVPETLDYKAQSAMAGSISSSASSSGSRDFQLRTVVRQSLASMRPFLTDARIFLIGAAFLVHMLFLNRDILLQYVSVRYQTSLAQATALISIRSGLVVLFSAVAIPALNTYFRARLQPKRSDLLLAKLSAIIFAMSFFGVALAPSLGLFAFSLISNALGWGLWSFIRSLLTSLVDSHNFAKVNTVLGVLDTVGLMLGSPLLAGLFEKGLELRGVWYGLPFLVCAGFVSTVALMLSMVSV